MRSIRAFGVAVTLLAVAVVPSARLGADFGLSGSDRRSSRFTALLGTQRARPTLSSMGPTCTSYL